MMTNQLLYMNTENKKQLKGVSDESYSKQIQVTLLSLLPLYFHYTTNSSVSFQL